MCSLGGTVYPIFILMQTVCQYNPRSFQYGMDSGPVNSKKVTSELYVDFNGYLETYIEVIEVHMTT